ncbi:MAG: DUF4388 domain-containing protein [Acidimicrobiales bacterium]
MSLEGSLETVALPEVLNLLADTSKSGELDVRGERADGKLWFGDGKLTGFDVGRSEAAVDALFQLLRITDGHFSFESGAELPDSAHRPDDRELKPVLGAAQVRLAEWSEIVAVIPSLEHVIRLAPEAPDGGVILDGPQWSLITAIGEGRQVQEVLESRSLGEFDGCRDLKALVDASVVVVASDPDADVDDSSEAEAPGDSAAAGTPATGVEDALRALFVDLPASNGSPGSHDGEPARDGAAAQDDAGSDAGEADGAEEPEGAGESAEEPATASQAAPDGLADRGPWTSGELASLERMGGWHEDEPDAAPASAGDADSKGAEAEDEAVADAEVDEPEQNEPINRGALLKFLSSVRS